jgi:Zn-dependent peptidase ImmA (M78 family)
MKKITRFHAVKILEWCKKRYGRGVKPYPVLQYKKPDYLNGEYACGEYDYEDDIIYVNSQMHTNLIDLANTIIHEYVHYRYHAKSTYYDLDRDYDHNDHPMEKQANLIAKKDEKKCVHELKKYYKQFNV